VGPEAGREAPEKAQLSEPGRNVVRHGRGVKRGTKRGVT
jgi:hypothetical protein